MSPKKQKFKAQAQEGAFSEFPTVDQLEAELRRECYKERYKYVLKSTVALLVVAAAAAILIVTLWVPVLRVYGSSMTPTLEDGDIVILTKSRTFQTGDVIAFYYNNKILIKRVIAESGDWVNIAEDGTVSVNGETLDEPYVLEPSYGECDLEFPYQVPVDRVFVMGDHRSVSVDSRSSQVGCIAQEQIVGKLKLRIWPLQRVSTL